MEPFYKLFNSDAGHAGRPGQRGGSAPSGSHLNSQIAEGIKNKLNSFTPPMAGRADHRAAEVMNQTFGNGQKLTSISSDWRDVGRWVVPPDAEDDGDYDWKVPVAEDFKKVSAAFQDWVKANVPAELKPKASVETSEKNWLSFTIHFS